MSKDNGRYKIVVVGGGAVGKSALTLRCIQSIFLEEYDPTIEDSYMANRVIDDEVAVLDILDTAGQEGFTVMREEHMRHGEGVLLVYSIIDTLSFKEIQTLYKTIIRIKEKEAIPCITLVANKMDLKSTRQVSQQEGENLAHSLNIGYIETSAKDGSNVEKVFYDLVRAVRKDRKDRKVPSKDGKTKKRFWCNIL